MRLRKLFAMFPPASTNVDMLEICQNHISIGLMYPNWLSSGMLNQFKVYRVMMMAALAPIRHPWPILLTEINLNPSTDT